MPGEKNQLMIGRRFLVSPIKIRDWFSFIFSTRIFPRVGGKDKNKTAIMYFYFYSFFHKNRVGYPVKQIIKKCWPYIRVPTKGCNYVQTSELRIDSVLQLCDIWILKVIKYIRTGKRCGIFFDIYYRWSKHMQRINYSKLISN